MTKIIADKPNVAPCHVQGCTKDKVPSQPWGILACPDHGTGDRHQDNKCGICGTVRYKCCC